MNVNRSECGVIESGALPEGFGQPPMSAAPQTGPFLVDGMCSDHDIIR